ncbi:hypothetical protein ZWY2020_002440 [Hordeum vulgare]|nr:hypothetical protein ZWY2020_002440 [Hordeum vulgare]
MAVAVAVAVLGTPRAPASASGSTAAGLRRRATARARQARWQSALPVRFGGTHSGRLAFVASDPGRVSRPCPGVSGRSMRAVRCAGVVCACSAVSSVLLGSLLELGAETSWPGPARPWARRPNAP